MQWGVNSLLLFKKRSSFSADVLKLAGGTIVAQAIGMIAMPIITRLYSPEAFGIAALFISITTILGIIICLCYEQAIILPEKDEDAANMLALCIFIAMLISSLTVSLIWIGQEAISKLLNAPNIGPYLWLIPPTIFINGLFLSLNYWNSRTRQYGRISIARLSSSIAATVIKLGAAFADYVSASSLIGASISGSVVSTLMLGGQIWREDSQFLKKNIRSRGIIFGLKRYKKFPLINTWSNLINTISWQMPIILLSSFFSQTEVGFYALGFTLMQLPMNLIGASISQASLQRIAEAKRTGSLSEFVEKMFQYLALFSVFPMLLLTILGKDIFILFFGERWAEAGVYTQILSVWAIFWFISSPLSNVIPILEKLEYGLKLSTVNLLTRFFAIFIGGLLHNVRLSITLYALSGIFVYGYLCLLILKESGVARIRGIKIIANEFLHFLPAGMILIIAKVLEVPKSIEMIIACIIFAMYVIYIFKTINKYLIISRPESTTGLLEDKR